MAQSQVITIKSLETTTCITFVGKSNLNLFFHTNEQFSENKSEDHVPIIKRKSDEPKKNHHKIQTFIEEVNNIVDNKFLIKRNLQPIIYVLATKKH